MKVVQEMLRHSSIGLTADTDTSVLPEVARNAAEKTAALLLQTAGIVPGIGCRRGKVPVWHRRPVRRAAGRSGAAGPPSGDAFGRGRVVPASGQASRMAAGIRQRGMTPAAA
ncbi:hypothetical protein [Actinomadura gamaensis]|uniref:Uncharacterized protein n=1 Tax=Actinomadura gamaensis TaxID=1763541 RepID=A0ABV9UCD6_9ACTN